MFIINVKYIVQIILTTLPLVTHILSSVIFLPMVQAAPVSVLIRLTLRNSARISLLQLIESSLITVWFETSIQETRFCHLTDFLETPSFKRQVTLYF